MRLVDFHLVSMSTFSPSLTVRHLGTQNYHTIRAGCMASAHSNVLTNHSHRRTITRRIVVIDTHRRCRHRFSTFLIGNHACIFGHIYSTPSNDLELSHGRSLSHGFSLQQRNQMNASFTPPYIQPVDRRLWLRGHGEQRRPRGLARGTGSVVYCPGRPPIAV